ncbi:hypothetical protein IA935_07350, partial [Listeria marthii]|uniref:T7SS effector LXG polymorphic toxin n=1 Tax=Listeria marthii TaxID=529731 RepID=UPI0019EA4DE7
MKIDVRELNELVNENIAALTKEHEVLSDAITATTTFTTETQEFFKGKTADASRAYLQEAYQPVQQWMLQINEQLTKMQKAYLDDAEAQFGANGLVDIPAIQMEYKLHLNQLTDREMQEYRELNSLIQEANEFIAFPMSNLGLFEELHHDGIAEIAKINMQLEGFETKWRNEFSKIENLQTELDAMLTQVDNNKITPTSYQAGMISFENVEKEAFIAMMNEQFGFNEEEAFLMYKLYNNLESKYGIEKSNEIFLLIMGTSVYDSLAWRLITDAGITHNSYGENLFWGITDAELKIIKDAVSNQHNICAKENVDQYVYDTFGLILNDLSQKEQSRYRELFKQFNDKTDFAHMAITAATILKGKGGETKIRDLAGAVGALFYNGIDDVDANAGYVGDVFGTFGAKPSMNSDDYKADLDAVIFAVRSNDNSSIISIMNEYYESINSGEINRVDEFIKGIGNGSSEEGMRVLLGQYRDHLKYLETKDMTEEEKSDHSKIAVRFIKNIQARNNDWIEY